MIVIVPHRDLELKLINAQKKIIKQIFDYNEKIIPYAAMPLWIPTDFTTVEEAKNAITKVTVTAPQIDVGIDSVVVEATGSEDKIESLIRLLEPFGILEYVKTGLTAMDRGSVVM